ncbi:hypothetical protein D3C73_1286450 [compost metagenome]
MYGMKLNAKRIRNNLIDLIPRDGFVRRNMYRFSDSMDVAHQTDETFSKIAIVRDGP